MLLAQQTQYLIQVILAIAENAQKRGQSELISSLSFAQEFININTLGGIHARSQTTSMSFEGLY
jgi:hypothetical protein